MTAIEGIVAEKPAEEELCLSRGGSGLIPIWRDFDFRSFVEEYIFDSNTKRYIDVHLGLADEVVSNSRGGIEYDFSDKKLVLRSSSELCLENSLRILFFVCHGIGHALQHRKGWKKVLGERTIAAASNLDDVASLYEQVKIDGVSTRGLGAFFRSHEQQASKIGWFHLSKFLKYKSLDTRLCREIGAVFFLFSVADNLYHRQSITGPFPVEPHLWDAVFAEKLEEAFYVIDAICLVLSLETDDLTLQQLLFQGTDGCSHDALVQFGELLNKLVAVIGPRMFIAT